MLMPNVRRWGLVMVGAYVPAELRDAAQAKADERGETVSAVIRRALERYVE